MGIYRRIVPVFGDHCEINLVAWFGVMAHHNVSMARKSSQDCHDRAGTMKDKLTIPNHPGQLCRAIRALKASLAVQSSVCEPKQLRP